MQPWIKYLIASLMLIFAAGTVMQKAHSVAVGPAMNLDMSLSVSTSNGGDIGCAGCTTEADGTMSCTMGCVAQFAGLPADMAMSVCRSADSKLFQQT